MAVPSPVVTKEWKLIWSQTLPSCVTLDKSLNPYCLVLIALLPWNQYIVLILIWKVRVYNKNFKKSGN